ncbi:MAG: uL22 family ribosomal protein [Candidatus Hydrothermales bacterium]
MVEGVARIKYLRTSFKKSKRVCEAIRGKTVKEALDILYFLTKKPAKLLYKAVKSACNSYAVKKGIKFDEVDLKNLRVKICKVDKGPTWRILRPGFRGVPRIARRHTAHFTVVVEEVK